MKIKDERLDFEARVEKIFEKDDGFDDWHRFSSLMNCN